MDSKELIKKFYSAFQQRDYETMQECYHADAVFFDPVFEDLNATETKYMWEMLCKNARGFTLEFAEPEIDEEYGTCSWVAKYVFTQTGKKVTNKVRAHFKFRDGLIVEHTDDFDLWKWSRQALGLPGWLIGWSNVLQKKIRKKAQDNLLRFMNSKIQNP